MIVFAASVFAVSSVLHRPQLDLSVLLSSDSFAGFVSSAPSHTMRGFLSGLFAVTISTLAFLGVISAQANSGCIVSGFPQDGDNIYYATNGTFPATTFTAVCQLLQ